MSATEDLSPRIITYPTFLRWVGMKWSLQMRRNSFRIGSVLVACSLGLTASLHALTETETTEGDTSANADIPVVYVVPLKGQMGTDIHEDVAEMIIEDALEVKPDVIVYQIESADFDRNYHLPRADAKEFGMLEMEAYRTIVRGFQNQLAESKQVVWVVDSVGFASLLALSWPDMYISPEGRLWGLNKVFDVSQGWNDADVREKMEEAWEGIGRGFLEMGGHGEFSRELGGAMMDPEKMLSARFKGRDVEWLASPDGMWLIDDNDEGVANFDAQSAEDTLLSDGIVESLDDLMFLLGYREYEKSQNGIDIAERYHEQWRRSYKKCLENLQDIESGRGGGTDALKQALNQKRLWEEILRNERRFGAVERRLTREYGLSKERIELIIDGINDQIRQIKDGRRGGGTRGGGGRGRTRGGPS